MMPDIKYEEPTRNIEEKYAGLYLAAFIDILGQRQELAELRSLPDKLDSHNFKIFFDQIRKTVGTVELFRKLFIKFYESSNKRQIVTSQFSPEQKQIYNQIKSNPVKLQMFSDFVALSLSLRDDINKVPMIGVYSVIASIGATCLTMLAGSDVIGSTNIRGGVDIGIGIELSNGDVYGAAIARAYKLENQVAQYSRIVLGDEFINYIQHQRGILCNSPFDIMNKRLAELCSEMIAIDEDGFPFIDYLGEGFKKYIGKNIEFLHIKRAYDFVTQEWAKWQKERNSKLAFRFMLLRDYFENRLHIWKD